MPMPALTTPSTEQRATGLGGAIGCSFRQAHNDLIFVEFAGRISKLSLVRPVAATVSVMESSSFWSFSLRMPETKASSR
mgnify:CR=1 FL=1